jgi:hypothetical protein
MAVCVRAFVPAGRYVEEWSYLWDEKRGSMKDINRNR